MRYLSSRDFHESVRFSVILHPTISISHLVISGGYDYKLMHHHYLYKTLLSQHDISES
jgi:hypothetical protein